MEQSINENRVLTSKVEYATLSDNRAGQTATLHFRKKLYADDTFLSVEEVVTVQIASDKIAVQRRKPLAQGAGQRPENTAIGKAVIIETPNAYANFGRSDAEITAILESYITPLYA